MPSFLPTDSWDFFKYPLKNVVEPLNEVEHECHTKTLIKKMTETNPRPFGTAISDIARWNLDGSKVRDDRKKVKVPYRLEFRGKHHFSNKKEYEELADGTKRWVMWYEQLQRIPENSTFYEVWGWTAPESLGGDLIHIADIKLRSPLHLSEFGDKRLFFRHRSIHHDRKYWPKAWRSTGDDPYFNMRDPKNLWGREVPDTWPAEEDAAKAMFDDQVATYGCPFQWLLAEE